MCVPDEHCCVTAIKLGTTHKSLYYLSGSEDIELSTVHADVWGTTTPAVQRSLSTAPSVEYPMHRAFSKRFERWKTSVEALYKTKATSLSLTTSITYLKMTGHRSCPVKFCVVSSWREKNSTPFFSLLHVATLAFQSQKTLESVALLKATHPMRTKARSSLECISHLRIVPSLLMNTVFITVLNNK